MITIKQGRIIYKTFIFTLVLLTLFLLVSFSILYFALPGYYLYTKNKALSVNTEKLARDLNGVYDTEQYAEIVLNFMRENNAEVFSFDVNGELLLEFSAPFLSIHSGTAIAFYIVNENINEDLSDTSITSAGGAKIKINRSILGVHDNGKAALYGISPEGITVLNQSIANSPTDNIMVSGTLQPIDESKSVILSLMPFVLLIDAIIAVIAAYLYSRQFTKPLLVISNATTRMQKLEYGIVSNVRTNDELGVLSKNLDSLYLSLCENIENLRSEMEKVHQLEQTKADFMRAASHELKTPIAAINGLLEGMIDNIGVYKNRDKYLVESKKHAERLAGLVEEILNVSGLNHNEYSLQCTETDIKYLIETILNSYQIFIDDKKLQIINECMDFSYNTDPTLFYHAISNIISNAVSYTKPDGKIIVSLKPDDDLVVLSIENQCEAIQAPLSKLFEPFYTLSYSRDKTVSGTGLGLYIVKRNLEILSLPYEVENTEMGFKFTIIF